jgi:hypothetical protein
MDPSVTYSVTYFESLFLGNRILHTWLILNELQSKSKHLKTYYNDEVFSNAQIESAGIINQFTFPTIAAADFECILKVESANFFFPLVEQGAIGHISMR